MLLTPGSKIHDFRSLSVLGGISVLKWLLCSSSWTRSSQALVSTRSSNHFLLLTIDQSSISKFSICGSDPDMFSAEDEASEVDMRGDVTPSDLLLRQPNEVFAIGEEPQSLHSRFLSSDSKSILQSYPRPTSWQAYQQKRPCNSVNRRSQSIWQRHWVLLPQ